MTRVIDPPYDNARRYEVLNGILIGENQMGIGPELRRLAAEGLVRIDRYDRAEVTPAGRAFVVSRR